MCSRSLPLLLQLLFVLAFVEVSSYRTPRLPLIENNIDFAKCVATRKLNNQYKCFIYTVRDPTVNDRQKCFVSEQYVQDSNTTSRLPPPSVSEDICSFGFTIRPLTEYAWEIEVLFYESAVRRRFTYFVFDFVWETGGRSSFIKVSLVAQHHTLWLDDGNDRASLYKPKIEEVVPDGNPNDDNYFKPAVAKIFGTNFKDPGTVRPYDVAQYNYIHEGNGRYYIRFRLYSESKKFTEYSHLTVKKFQYFNDANENEEIAKIGILRCPGGACDAMIPPNTCGQMMQMVKRKKSVPGWGHLTKIPREAFHHNVNDFTQMCNHLQRYNQSEDIFKPYHVEKEMEIVAIECLPEKENDQSPLATRIPYSILRFENGSLIEYNNFKNKYRDKKEINYQFVEVTCRAKEEICFYCGEPEWNKDTASIPKGLAPMIFRAGKSGGCATLTCPADSLPYYPHISFTSLEPPRCEYNEEKDAFEWTFSFQPRKQWNRVRKPLERGYCRKKSPCPDFTERMLACPKHTAHMPWFIGCEPVTIDKNPISQRFHCPSANDTKQLYFAFSRRILQKPAIGIVCNPDTGLYEAHLSNGKIETGFTEESWVVCRDKPIRKYDTYWNNKNKDLSLMAKAGAGMLLGLIIPIVIALLFLGVRYPIVRCLKRQREETLQPEQLRQNVVPPEVLQKLEEEKKKKRAGLTERVDADEDYKKVLAAREAMAKRMKEIEYVQVDHNRDEKTCRLPTKSEQEILDEIDRLKECTSEEDQTGRDVKPIAREGEPDRG